MVVRPWGLKEEEEDGEKEEKEWDVEDAEEKKGY